jgi:hypothetical protein
MIAPRSSWGNGVRRVYKAVPEKVWMNDDIIEDGKFIKDIRVEVPLEQLKIR